MSVRSYTKIWLHLIWGTHNKDKLLLEKSFRKELSTYLYKYSKEKGIYMKINYVNSDHVHAIINLPTNYTIEEVMKLIKGNSSFWTNKKLNFKFSWARGYGAFSISESVLPKVENYIRNQGEHHRQISFTDEYELFLKKYNIKTG